MEKLTFCIIYRMEQASFLHLGKLLSPFLSMNQLPKCYPLRFQCHEIYLRVFFMRSFCWCYSLWDILILSFMSVSLLSQSSSGCRASLSRVPVSILPLSVITSATPLMMSLNSTYDVVTFCFICFIFIFVGQFPLSVICVCKTTHGFITGR